MPGTSQGPTGLGRPAALVTAALLALSASPAAAQALSSKYWFEVSGYRPSIDTDASVSRPGQPGTDIDLERDLNLDNNEILPAVYAGARLGKRWVVAGEYYALDRNGTNVLNRTIDFDGATFPISATVESKLQSDIYRLTVGYAFIQNDQAEFGVALGLHATQFELSLEGQATTGGAGFTTERRARDFVAPLPTVGVFGTYQATDRVSLTARADYLSLKIKDYDGSILNAQAAASYRVYKNVEVGLAYRYVDYNLDVEKERYTATLDYKFNGPSLFLRFGFR